MTVIILTFNEQENIVNCLQNLSDFDDIVVVDSCSNDDTLNRAKSFGSKVRVFQNPFEDFGSQRNWAIDNIPSLKEWILFVDADEYCDRSLSQEIESLITGCGSLVGGYIAGRNFFLGRWLRFSTFYPAYQLRLLKRGQVRFRKFGHGQREVVDGDCAYLKVGWRHESFSKGVENWIGRHNRYSTDEADMHSEIISEPLCFFDLFASNALTRRRALRRLGARLPCSPILLFLYIYVFKRGFLDGAAGFWYCTLILTHQIHVRAKIVERRYAQDQSEV